MTKIPRENTTEFLKEANETVKRLSNNLDTLHNNQIYVKYRDQFSNETTAIDMVSATSRLIKSSGEVIGDTIPIKKTNKHLTSFEADDYRDYLNKNYELIEQEYTITLRISPNSSVDFNSKYEISNTIWRAFDLFYEKTIEIYELEKELEQLILSNLLCFDEKNIVQAPMIMFSEPDMLKVISTINIKDIDNLNFYLAGGLPYDLKAKKENHVKLVYNALDGSNMDVQRMIWVKKEDGTILVNKLIAYLYLRTVLPNRYVKKFLKN